MTKNPKVSVKNYITGILQAALQNLKFFQGSTFSFQLKSILLRR